MPAICSRTISLNTEAWPSVRAMTWTLSGSRSEICSSSALIGAGSTFAGIKPSVAQGADALSRYCIGVRTTTSFIIPSFAGRPSILELVAETSESKQRNRGPGPIEKRRVGCSA